MNLYKLSLLEGAKVAKGTTVIIDVFRAFTVACYLFENGARKVYPVGSVEEALLLKETNPEFILIGERNERKCDGFDFGNSPTHIKDVDFTGKTIVHTTSSGTQGIVLAKCAEEIISGAFVNVDAIVRYIERENPKDVSLVAMGYEGLETTQEDELCANYIEKSLLGQQTNKEEIVEILKTGDGARLLDPKNKQHSPASDFDFCLDFNRFDFVLKLREDDSGKKYFQKVLI